MRRGVSLHIGVNWVDGAHYAGWTGDLLGCEADAEAMHELCKRQGFSGEVLTTAAATRDALALRLAEHAMQLRRGDTFILTYSGHGGSVPDTSGEERDGRDETWCLYDGQFLDDELAAFWAMFKPGVRIAVVSDSCHSGSVADTAGKQRRAAAARARSHRGPAAARAKSMPVDLQLRALIENRTRFPALETKSAAAPENAQVVLIAACQDDERTLDGAPNCEFTTALLRTWNDGAFTGSHAALTRALCAALPNQNPRFSGNLGKRTAFARGRPFTI